MRYYYCINCGHNHNFGFDRQKNIYCRRCSSKDYLIEIKKEEYENSHPSAKSNTIVRQHINFQNKNDEVSKISNNKFNR